MDDGIDIDNLLKVVQKEENQGLINTNFSEIKKIKNDILQKLQLTKNDLKDLHKKLSKYRYIDEISDLRFGSFIRYIPINDPENMHLARGGILCDIIINDDGVNLTFKTFTHQHFQIKMQECLLFQKLSHEEHILLSAIEYIQK